MLMLWLFGVAEAGPICGFGTISFTEAVCVDGFIVHVEVGGGFFDDSSQNYTLYFGEESECFSIDRDLAGGTETTLPDPDCTESCVCQADACDDLPSEGERCGSSPPPPPPPPPWWCQFVQCAPTDPPVRR